MDITKADIIKYFGSVDEYTSYLNNKKYQLTRQRNELKELRIEEIFSPQVVDLSINNKGFYDTLTKSVNEMIATLTSQIDENAELRKYVESL